MASIAHPSQDFDLPLAIGVALFTVATTAGGAKICVPDWAIAEIASGSM
jgi:hypothetical protein